MIKNTMEVVNYLSSFLVLLSFAIFFIFNIIIRRRRNRRSKYESKVNFYDIVKNGHRFLEWTNELLLAAGPDHTISFPGVGIVLTANPANVEHVIKTNFRNYPKGRRVTAPLEDLLGGGIFNSDGEQWHIQRKIASLQFNSKSFRTFVAETVRTEIVTRLLPFLSTVAAATTDSKPQIIDLQDTLDRFAFDIVCKITFDYDAGRLGLGPSNEQADSFARSYDEATRIVMKRLRAPSVVWKLKRLLNIGAEARLKRELRAIKQFAASAVEAQKEKKGIGANHLLSRFAEAGGFSDEELADVALNFVLAGRDTTSSAMSWLFWLLSWNPRAERRILDEVRSAGGAFGPDELRGMDYLHAALAEAMRLYPPVAVESRSCAERDVLPDGTRVAGGGAVLYSAYAMGRTAGVWGEDCGEFRPERWLDDDAGRFRPASPCRYPVFHAGPRACLGKEMAYAQMKAVVASVLDRFVVEVAEEGEREQDLDIVLRMKKGLPVRIRARAC